FLTRGYDVDPKQVINGALFVEEYSEMIVLKDIDFYSMCEHHVLPFFGKAHVAYLPQHRIIGISKIARLVEIFARRLQVQERMTTQIANTIMEELDPLGVGVVLEAEHLCMRMRGVEKQNSVVVTSAMLAALRNRLPAGAPLVLLDHSQPRALWRRAVGILVLAARGLAPSRARYPAARELAAIGFAVERLRLACGERVQMVVARRRPPP